MKCLALAACSPLAAWERCEERTAEPHPHAIGCPARGRNCRLVGDDRRLLGWRVDALTLAYRVELSPLFVRALRARQEVANVHRFAGFQWGVMAPAVERSSVLAKRRIGSVRAVWGDEEPEIRRSEWRSMLWGELKQAASPGVYRLTNKPYFRMQILERGPGASEPSRLDAGQGTIDPSTGEVLPAAVADPGWTVEIIWEAQALARRELADVIAESHALAGLCGNVLEARVRRVDVCADVAGWTIERSDVERLAKRPHARWSREFAAEADADARGTAAQDHGTGALERRRMTGLTVGRGGALMARIYDKRAEVDACGLGAVAVEDGPAVSRRELERERWTAAGWDGVAPVTRVEFQIRGCAVDELGLRNPDAALEVVEHADGTKDRQTVRDAAGNVVGLAGRLAWIWATCLDWVRLVVPRVSKRGKRVAVSRLADDPRWALLRSVRWGDEAARPIRRFRARGVASEAQALGVTLSHAGRDGLLREWEETPDAYHDVNAESVLRERVRALKADEVERIVAWLLERGGGAVGANIHLAVRANAARLRFKPRMLAGLVRAEERGPPESGVRSFGARVACA